MDRVGYLNRRGRFGTVGGKIFEAAAFALMLLMVTPARAGDARAIKTRVPPAYPEIAKRMRVSGVVKLEAAVDAQGKVTDVKELSGNHTLAEAAKQALLQWKFAPASSQSSETVAITFDLGQE